jgi:Zn-finger nucleic acid-binding protein
MKCPIDDSPLSVSSREGVEIDFCPQCRGVWLDRGELDKIIDRAANALAGSVPAAAPPDDRSRHDDRRDDRYDRPYDDRSSDRPADDRSSRKRRKRSFLEDIFDFE